MAASRNRRIWDDLTAVTMVTAALIGVLFFGWKVAGLPFVPFDAFDRVTRVPPGRVIAFDIGTMVNLIMAQQLCSEGSHSILRRSNDCAILVQPSGNVEQREQDT
jgi:hypothetical protein